MEEPMFLAEHVGAARLDVTQSPEGVTVVVAQFGEGISHDEAERIYGQLLRDYLASENVSDYVLWYYTPMALPWAEELSPLGVVYDCMDQLSAFKNAPPALTARERELFSIADVVFTGGQSLYEAKKQEHPNVHAFPSSVDVAHFGRARTPQPDPEDQRWLPGPRLGFFGVIDERMDLDLLAGVAASRPSWQLVMLGPVVKVDPADLPKAPNIHYLGGKSYDELPSYIAGWDVALLPFARNESTQFISPTKTPEYLAAGKPVVSTSIRDVVRPYQRLGLVRIADSVDAFVAACEQAMREPVGQRLLKADAYLSHLSWDRTWREMQTRLEQAIERRRMNSSPRLLTAEAERSALLDVALGGE